MGFYKFEQTPIGGYFITNEKLCRVVVIEADSTTEANDTAKEMGIDLNGYEGRWDMGEGCLDLNKLYNYPAAVLATNNDGSFVREWEKKFGKYEIIEEPKQEEYYYKGIIKFKDVEEYIQFLSTNYGLTLPDARIFYKDGTLKAFS